jgi:hypothetical protein
MHLYGFSSVRMVWIIWRFFRGEIFTVTFIWFFTSVNFGTSLQIRTMYEKMLSQTSRMYMAYRQCEVYDISSKSTISWMFYHNNHYCIHIYTVSPQCGFYYVSSIFDLPMKLYVDQWNFHSPDYNNISRIWWDHIIIIFIWWYFQHFLDKLLTSFWKTNATITV